jgi:hypothetical protein
MGKMTVKTLLDIVSDLASYGDELTVYAVEPWTCESVAFVAMEPDDGTVPPECASHGAVYFIELFIAKEFLVGWAASQAGDVPHKEACERLIQYATDDA